MLLVVRVGRLIEMQSVPVQKIFGAVLRVKLQSFSHQV